MPATVHRLPAILAIALVLITTATGTGLAVDEPRDAPSDTSPPVRVYVSESLDISDVQLTGGGTIGTDRTTFVSVSGDEVFSVNPESADFDDVEPGSYDADSDDDDDAELVVVQPRITDFDVRNERGVDIAGDTVEGNDFEEVTITAEYSFAEADRLDVTVENPDGLDLAGNRRITTSGGSVTVDTSGADPGEYRIIVEGSNIEDGRASTTVTVAGGTARPTATATPTPTSTPTPTATSTSTPTATATSTPTSTPTPATTTSMPTPATTEKLTATPTATQDDGPGFGPVLALLAVLTVAVLAHRRE